MLIKRPKRNRNLKECISNPLKGHKNILLS
nr:MAG TPA: hypothetical protein [Bacteriophage sp.]